MWNENRNDAVALEGRTRLESPLVGAQDLLAANQALKSKAFRLRERPFLELVNVRGDASDAAFVSAFEKVIGTRLPVKSNTVAQASDYDVLWLGPDEWLVRSSEPRASELEARLEAAFVGTFATAVDVGSGYTVLEASGERVRDVISRGCPLDLHPRVLARGQCAQSHYFKASIVLLPTADDTFEIVVRRSFADYFCRIMLDAAQPLL
jgi:sarcosine oxidase subunit gamma